jgi:murein DD-endopeptidase MepM/ murein hydrolase activator NlpD
MIRRIAGILLLLIVAWLVWVVILNLPGRGGGISSKTDEINIVEPVSPARHIASGKLVMPVAGVMSAQLVDSFADPRGDGSRSHGAIDIMAARGTPVLATAAGTVDKLFDSKAGGLTIYVRRSGGAWIDYYAHLDSYAAGLAEGQKVAQGQVIGAVGSTGDASAEGPHLHYEIKMMAPGEGWWQGRGIDPYPLLGGK